MASATIKEGPDMAASFFHVFSRAPRRARAHASRTGAVASRARTRRRRAPALVVVSMLAALLVPVGLLGSAPLSAASGNGGLAAPGDITTVAGTGTPGTSPNGTPAYEALLANTRGGAVVDGAGDVFVADSSNNRVLEVPATTELMPGTHTFMQAGDIYTIAGSQSGEAGDSADGPSDNTPGPSALLHYPVALALDGAGDLLIADAGNNRVEELAVTSHTQFGIAMTAGDLYTVAGNDQGAYGDSGDTGPATQADLANPTGVAIDAAGDLLVSDTDNNRIQMVPAQACGGSGEGPCQLGTGPMAADDIYTIAGSPGAAEGLSANGTPAASSLLRGPAGIAIDLEDNLYVADADNNRVEMLSARTGMQWGQHTLAGDLYILVGGSSGAEDGAAGSSTSGTPASEALVDDPQGLGLDPSGDLYIADTKNDVVEEVPRQRGTQWGITMSPDDLYVVAGTPGSAGSSGDGGPTTSALFDQPLGITVSNVGNVFVADSGNSEVRELTADPAPYPASDLVERLLGIPGSAGSLGDGGPGPKAELSAPAGVLVDAAGNLYVSDAGENRVQEVPARNERQWGRTLTAGIVTTILGSAAGASGTSGNGVAGTSFLLKDPRGLAMDSAGDLYVADGGNNRVVELAAATGSQKNLSMTNGDGYTVVGQASGAPGRSTSGTYATSAYLDDPAAVGVDQAGDLYVSDEGNDELDEVAATGEVDFGISMSGGGLYVLAGDGTPGSTGNGGPGTAALLDAPVGLALDPAGDVYLADSASNEVRELAASSGTQWGQSMATGDIYDVIGAGTAGTLSGPEGVALDPAGDVLVADTGENEVRLLAATSGTEWGQQMTSGDLYTIAGSTSSGDAGDGGPGTAATFAGPSALVADQSGQILVCDTGNDEVRALVSTNDPLVTLDPGTISTILGTGAYGYLTNGVQAADGGLDNPRGVITDQAGDVYVADTSASRVQEIAASTHTQFGIQMTAGDVYTIAGSAYGGSGGTGNGLGTSVSLDQPMGLALDGEGDLYIADSQNNEVRELSAFAHTQDGISMQVGYLYDVAGSEAGTAGDGQNGTAATSAGLNDPTGVVLDASGDLLVADAGNNRVVEVPATSGTYYDVSMTAGDLYTIAGSASGQAGDKGAVPATQALLASPGAVATDPAGDLFLASAGDNQVDEVPVTSGTHYGVQMTADDLYDIAGQPGGASGSAGDGGPGTSASLDFPVDLALDGAGNLVIADSGNSRIRELSNETGTQWGQSMTAGDLYTVAGTGTAGASGDGGAPASAELDDPYAVALDAEGNLYVADTANDEVREATSPLELVEQGGPNLTSEMLGGANPSEAGAPQPTRAATDAKGTGLAVDLVTGEVSITAADDALAGRGPEAGLTRSYSDLVAMRQASPGPFGFGWTDDDAMAIGADPVVAGAEDVTQENGSVVTFVPAPSGGYVAATRVQASLTKNGDGTWTFSRPGGDTYAFNASGELTSITDRNGYATTLSYSSGELSSVSAPGGDSLSFTWGSCGSFSCITKVTDSAGRSLTYGYDSSGDLTSATTIGGATTTYTYDAAHRVTSVENALAAEGFTTAQRTTTNTYDDAGRLLAQTDPMGYTTSYAYAIDTTGSGTTTVTDPKGIVDAYGFTGGELTSQTLAKGTSVENTGSLSYDPFTDQATSGKNKELKNAIVSAFDAEGDVLETLDPDGRGSTYTYDAEGDVLSATSPLGEVTTTTYDGGGNPTGSSWPLPDGTTASTSVGYSSSYPGDAVSAVDANHNTTQTSYDPNGNEDCAIDGVGNMTTSYYGAAGSASMVLAEEQASVSGVGNEGQTSCPSDGTAPAAPSSTTYETTYAYDSFGNRTKTTAPQTTGIGGAPVTHITSSTYDELGDVLTSTDANGNVTTYTYDPDHELTSEQLPGGNCSASPAVRCLEFGYDADGENVSSTDADEHATTYTYDALGRVLTSTDALSHTTTYAYSFSSDSATVTDPDQNATTEHFDPAGQVIFVTQPDSTTFGSTYDAAGDETSYTDAAGDTTFYDYDDLGELTAVTNPLGEVTSFTYDPNGNQSTEHDSDGNTTSWTYNGNNQVTDVLYSGGPSPTPSASQTYTPDGLLETMSDGSGTSHFSYDAADELTAYTNGAGESLSYLYDGDGNVTQLTYPGNHIQTTTYNDQSLPATVTDASNNKTIFSYDGNGNVTGIAYPNGIVNVTSYNAANELTSISDTLSGATVESFTYTRNNDGLATYESDVGTPSPTSYGFGYNQLNELNQAGPQPFTYDHANNLTTSPGGKSQGFNAGDELCYQAGSGGGSGTCSSPPTGATTYAYSSVGNRTSTSPASGGPTTYAWNDAHQLTGVTTPSSSSTDVYDGLGLLESETTSAGTTDFLWNPESQVPELLEDGTNVYLYGPGTTPFEQVNLATGAVSYLLADHLGTVRGITSSSGALTGAVTDDAWGNVLGTSGTFDTPFGFAGGYKDAVSGLLYFRARWYDPATGQWMSVDPALSATDEPYGYAGNDPVGVTDMTGLDWLSYELAQAYIQQQQAQGVPAAQAVAAFAPPAPPASVYMPAASTYTLPTPQALAVIVPLTSYPSAPGSGAVTAPSSAPSPSSRGARDQYPEPPAGAGAGDLGSPGLGEGGAPGEGGSGGGAGSPVTTIVDVSKFRDYAFVTDKAPVFKAYGYTAEDSERLAKLYMKQGARKVFNGDYTIGKQDEYGTRITINIDLPGVGAESGRSTILKSGWMYQSNGSIRLLTPFAGFAR